MKLSLPPFIVRCQPLLIVLAPVAVLAVSFFAFIQPRMTAGKTAHARLAPLEQRVVSVQAALAAAPAAEAGDARNTMPEFERRTPAGDRVPDLLEQLAGLAAADAAGEKVQHLLLETGKRVVPPPPKAGEAPRVATIEPDAMDPRLALFRTPLSYTPVTMTFESSYARLGRFFWELRALPTLVEVRSVEVGPVAQGDVVHTRLVILAFQRATP